MKDIVDRLESEFQKKARKSSRSKRWTSASFPMSPGELDAGYFVNFIFHAEPDLITKLRTKFKLDPEVYRQHYQRLQEKKEQPAKKNVAEAELPR